MLYQFKLIKQVFSTILSLSSAYCKSIIGLMCLQLILMLFDATLSLWMTKVAIFEFLWKKSRVVSLCPVQTIFGKIQIYQLLIKKASYLESLWFVCLLLSNWYLRRAWNQTRCWNWHDMCQHFQFSQEMKFQLDPTKDKDFRHRPTL